MCPMCAPVNQEHSLHDHSTYSYPSIAGSDKEESLEVNLTSQPCILSVIPTIGPLHISLNSREHVVNSFHPFFKMVYEKIFPSSKLADKPKPWRISLLLEVVYGGWTLIRHCVISKFWRFKDAEYGTLFNLLDNYIPLVLSIYSISFKLNYFSEYFRAMTKIWIMFTCLKRRHYNKAPLVWINIRSSNLKANRPTSDLISHLLRSFLFPRTNYNSLISNVLKYYAQCLRRSRHHQDSLHFLPTELPVAMLLMSSSLTSVKTTRSKCLYYLLDTILKLGQTKQNSVTCQTVKIQTQMKTGFF